MIELVVSLRIESQNSLPTTLLKRHQLFPQNPDVAWSLNANSHFSSAHFHDRHNDILANDDLLVLQSTQNQHSTFSLKFVVTETNDLMSVRIQSPARQPDQVHSHEEHG